MSQIVLGLATPHAPQLRLPFEGWLALKQKDETDTRIDFEGLRKAARPGIEDEVTEARMGARYQACQDNLRALGKRLAGAAPDAIVILGDDQREQFHSDNMPMFCVYHGAGVELEGKGREEGREKSGVRSWSAPRLRELQRAADEALIGPRRRPAEASLGAHLISTLRDADFDVSASDRLRPGAGLGHAFAFLYQHLLPGTEIPIVPVMVNTLFPPNQPTPARCYALGQALARAIRAWPGDKRVAVVASGGLSHTVIDEGLDRRTLAAIIDKDEAALKALPRDKLRLGTSEILNWVAAAGALEAMTPGMIGDYIPAYRTAAGTGCGMGFVTWAP
ncbi:MAG: extradiol ring-cleavage dioxygenase [Alphaproteobacteria bacterium]|nr:extradiol ring-cleavage dioxygenase [Alphaproteobacteria bacterium]